jgi:hypothetical protein
MQQLALVLTLLGVAGTATAQPSTNTSPPQGSPPEGTQPDGTQPAPDATQPPQQPTTSGAPMSTLSTLDASATPTMPPEQKSGPKEPKAGDFNAGGQARFPSGPDETGQFASFNWVAADLKGRYYLLKTVTLDANIPLAIIKPDTVGMMGPEPKMFGGFTLTLDARVKAPKMPGVKYDTDIGAALTFGYMREGAMLLSDKDYPLFLGDLKPGFAGGLITKVKLSSLVDFSFIPTWVYQSGSTESLQAIQIPISLILKLGEVAKLSFDLGVYTGDDYSARAKNGGRLTTGAALDLKIGPMLLHAGAGFASLLTDDMRPGAYPTITDSFYVDLNAKYAK